MLESRQRGGDRDRFACRENGQANAHIWQQEKREYAQLATYAQSLVDM